MNKIVALLESRIQHLLAEEARNKRSGYADVAKWRRLEVQYLVGKIKELEAKT